jgi:hypothetical protein
MTETEKHAVVGRVLTEKKEAENHLAHLRAEAKRLGQLLESLGKELKNDPSMVRFERQPVNVIYSSRDQALYKAEDVDGSSLAKLTAEIRDTMDKVETLTAQARELGF